MNRSRIGILIDSIEDQCEYEICQGILNYFEKLNVQTVIIEGVHNYKQDDSKEQYIRTINVIKKSNLKGLIILSSFFLDYRSKDELDIFIKSLNNLPIVSVGEEIDSIPSIMINEETSLFSLVDYLIDNKKCKNFAFMFESVNNEYSNKRLSTIISHIEKRGIDTKKFNFHHFEYENQKQTKLETSKLVGQSLILPDVILCYDDYIAIGVIDFLKSSNINVPEDIIVTGFDNITTNNPFLTKLITIKQPFYKVGLESATTLCKLIENYTVELVTEIECVNVINKTTNISEIHYSTEIINDKEVESLENLKIDICNIINSVPEGSIDNKRILINLLSTIEGLYPVFNEINITLELTQRVTKNSFTVHTLTGLRTILKQCIIQIKTNTDDKNQLISLFSIALTTINDEMINILANDSYDRSVSNGPSALAGQIMLRSESLKDLLNKLPEYLESYSFESFYLFLYKYDFSYKSTYNMNIPEHTELVYAKCDNNLSTLPLKFETQMLIPDWDILDNKHNYIFIMLFYNHVPVGYLFVNINSDINPNHFGIIRINLETALYNILRFEESKNKVSLEREYYLTNFNKIKNKVMEIENYYDIVSHNAKSNNYLTRLGESLQSVKRNINHMFIDDEEILSMDRESFTPVLSYLIGKKIPHTINDIDLDDNGEIYLKIDQYTLDYIIKRVIDNNFNLNQIKLTSFNENILLKFYLEHILIEHQPDFKLIKKVLDYCEIPFSFIDKGSLKILTLNLTDKKQNENIQHHNEGKVESEKTILLLGSDKGFNSSLSDIFSSKFNVITYTNILSATENLSVNKNISMIVSDITEENIWGNISVKSRYQELINEGIPAIFLSGNTSRKEIISSLKLGVVDYLQKPISSMEILLRIENHIRISSINKQYFVNKFEKTLMEVIESDFSLSDIKIRNIAKYLKVNFNLTPREVEVVKLMVNKLYHRQIAIEMNLSEQTVKNISHVIYKKCNVSGKTELINLINSNELTPSREGAI